MQVLTTSFLGGHLLRNVPTVQSCASVRYLRKPKCLTRQQFKLLQDERLRLEKSEFLAMAGLQEVYKDTPVDEFHTLQSTKSYKKSLRCLQESRQSCLQNFQDSQHDEQDEHIKNEIYGNTPPLLRLIKNGSSPTVRVKSSCDKVLVEEFIAAFNEIQNMKRSKEIVEKKVEEVKQKIMNDMENLKLEDLDEAIEKAMSSVVNYKFLVNKTGNVVSKWNKTQ